MRGVHGLLLTGEYLCSAISSPTSARHAAVFYILLVGLPILAILAARRIRELKTAGRAPDMFNGLRQVQLVGQSAITGIKQFHDSREHAFLPALLIIDDPNKIPTPQPQKSNGNANHNHLPVAGDPAILSDDDQFIKRATDIVQARLSDATFDVDQLAEEMSIGRRQLTRRLVEITGEPPAALIRRMRFDRATQMLQQHAGSVSEIAHWVGFRSASHFSAAFRRTYGAPPTEFPNDIPPPPPA